MGTTAALLLSAAVGAHEAPNLEHTHAFQKDGYGAYRQGHYVNGPTGSIIIWSPQLYTGYPDDPPVQFARPRPITKAPGSVGLRPPKMGSHSLRYGAQPNRDYGD
jgi:hypothetical protein